MKAIKVGRTERKHLEVPRDRTNTASILAQGPLIAKDILLATARAGIHKFRVGLGSATTS